MIYNIYALWNMYLCMRTIHGLYITFSFFMWFSESTAGTVYWLSTFIYNPYEQKQIEDSKENREVKIEIFDDYLTEDPKNNLC
mgnify:FL=1